MRSFLIAVLGLGISLHAWSLSAPTLFVPPPAQGGKIAHERALNQRAAQWLRLDFPLWVYRDYEGQAELLKEAGSASPLQVAVGVPIDEGAAFLFDTALTDAASTVWLAGLQSVDAQALRLHIDLNRLNPGELLWLVDPEGPRLLGPYSVTDAELNGTWLATTTGDTVILALESPVPVLPDLHVQQVSHYYRSPLEPAHEEKGAQCPIPIACETDPEILNAATGVGRLIIAARGGQQFLCTGSLLNNATTVEREPYFISANHCFPQSTAPSSVEVIWDFRAQDCAAENIPALSSLPRSQGREFLAINPRLDAQFLELDDVPIGTRGRAWLGWETGPVEINADAISIHHPLGMPQELNRGSITRLNVSSILGENQVQVRWFEGVTNNGSSGAPALLTEGGLRVFGMLSNGVDQSCDNNNPRLDQYASLQLFFPEIQVFLTGQAAVSSTGCADASTPSSNRAAEFFTITLALLCLFAMAARGKSGPSRP